MSRTAEVVIEPATEADVATIVALVNAGAVGSRVGRETDDLTPYLAAFRRIAAHPDTEIYVARDENGEVVGTFQLTVLLGLAFQGGSRAQLESVHTRADRRGQGIGGAMVRFAEERARALGCMMMQLTSNKQRADAHRFYERLGYERSHEGFKRML